MADGATGLAEAGDLLAEATSAAQAIEGHAADGSLEGLAATGAAKPVDVVRQSGFDWLVPAVEPFQRLLDQLAGDPAAIRAFTDAWHQVAEKVTGTRGELQRLATSSARDLQGETGDSFRKLAADFGTALDAFSTTSTGLGVGADRAGRFLAGVRSTVQRKADATVSHLVSWTQTAVAQAGGVTPEIMQQAMEIAKQYLTELDITVRELHASVGQLIPLVRALVALLPRIGRVLGSVAKALAKAWRSMRGKSSPANPPLTPTQQAALDAAKNSNKMHHVFVPKHKLDPLVQKFGSQEAAMEQIVRNLGSLPKSGPFEVTRQIGGQSVTIRGAVTDGVPKIGTVFTP